VQQVQVVGVAGEGDVTAGVVEEEYIQCASFIKKGTAATAMLALTDMIMSSLARQPLTLKGGSGGRPIRDWSHSP